MASTNKTTYFELSQFIGSDHPTWLSDVNGDMLKIDTALQSIKNIAEHADSLAESGAINIEGNTSDISDLQDAVTGLVAKMGSGSLTNLGGNVSGALGNTSIAGVANSISEAIVALKTAVDAINNKFNFSDTGTVSGFHVTAGGDDFGAVGQTGSVSGSMRYALNPDKTAGKIYGQLNLNNFVGSGGRITIETGLTISNASGIQFNINGLTGDFYSDTLEKWYPVSTPYFIIGPTGKVSLSFICRNVADTYTSIRVYMPPCIYFFGNFGD